MRRKELHRGGLNFEPQAIPPEQLPEGKNYLLAIGIDTYTHLPTLSNAVKDAQEVIQVLTDRYQFGVEEVIALFDSAATERNIRKELDRLIDLVTPNDSLLIYFAGHGKFHEKRKRGYWIPVDAEPGQTADYIDNSVVRDYIMDIQSRHTFLVSDSCYSGSFFRQMRSIDSPEEARNFHYKKIEFAPSRWALMAGGLEKVSDGKAGESSPFNRSFINCLKYNLDPHLSVLELIIRVQKAVGNNHAQQPIGNRIYGVDDFGQGQMVFHLNPSLVPVQETDTSTQQVISPPTTVATPLISQPETPELSPLPQEPMAHTTEDPYAEEAASVHSINMTQEDWDAEQLVNEVLQILRTQTVEVAAQMSLPYLHRSLYPYGQLEERFYRYNWAVAHERVQLYEYPVTFIGKKTSSRTQIGRRPYTEKGTEYIYSIKRLKETGSLPPYIRIFFPESRNNPVISGVSL